MVRTPNWPNLALGQNGANVRALQFLLDYCGYGNFADGSFGKETYSAVIRFQSDQGLSAE